MVKRFPHELFASDYVGMLREVRRQEELDPANRGESIIGDQIFYFFGEDILPLVKQNDWVYEAATEFGAHYANDYFRTIELLESIESIQQKLVAMKEKVERLTLAAMKRGLAPPQISVPVLSAFYEAIDGDRLPSALQTRAKRLRREAVALEHLYVDGAVRGIQSLYEIGLPRLFYVVRRALKVKYHLRQTEADINLLEPHEYLDWCKTLDSHHVINTVLRNHQLFYKVTRNVASHKTGAEYLPDTFQVFLPDRDCPMTMEITVFSQLYRYLVYFCEIGVRGILAAMSDRERGAISNSLIPGYLTAMGKLELETLICEYPV